MPMCHAPSLRRPRRYPRRLSQLPARLPSPSPFQLPALLRTASGQRANVLPQSDLARALPRELPRITPPSLSRRRAVASLADVDETLPEEASSRALPLARCYWQRVRRVSQQLLNSCLVRGLARFRDR